MKAVKHKSPYNTIKGVIWRQWNTSYHITSKSLFHHLHQLSLDFGGGFWTKWSWLCQEGRNQNCTLPLVLPQHQSRAQPPAAPRSSHRSLCHWRPALHRDKQCTQHPKADVYISQQFRGALLPHLNHRSLSTQYITIYNITLLPSVNTLTAPGMFCGAKYSHHTFTPIIKH